MIGAFVFAKLMLSSFGWFEFPHIFPISCLLLVALHPSSYQQKKMKLAAAQATDPAADVPKAVQEPTSSQEGCHETRDAPGSRIAIASATTVAAVAVAGLRPWAIPGTEVPMDKEQEIVFAPDEPYREEDDFELPEDYWETFPRPKPIGQGIGIGNG